LWKVDIHSQGVAVGRQLAEFVDQQLEAALAGLERRVVSVHVRLYEGEGADRFICHVRVDFAHGGGVARGHSAEDARLAVSRASAQIRAAAVGHISGTRAVHVRRVP
jgi:Sigma 54 modulation protein / S30EA ribosomal protein